MRTVSIATLAVVAGLAGAAPVRAQNSVFLRTGETYQHLTRLRQESRADDGMPAVSAAAVAASGGRRQGTILMIVGAAGIVTGLIVDEDILTIAGAGVAGLGLYFYLDSGGKVEVGARRSFPALAH
jgi:hypothetical protein